MNREIKFRAWSKSDKEMTPHERIRILPDETELHEVFEDNSVIWMQFTGLLDKNGNEIYEGDILSWESYEGKKHQTRWVVEYNSERGFKSWSSTKNDEIVIGNIHENPELLK